MAIDSTLAARKAVMAALKADADMVALVPASRIYPHSAPPEPAWPFVIIGPPDTTPIRASCLDGSEVVLTVFAYSKGRLANNALVETAEDHAARIGAAIARALDKHRATIPGGELRVQWTGGALRRDGAERDAFQTRQNLLIRCVTV